MKKNQLIIATRESPLAFWQANWVKYKLKKLYPTLFIQLLGLTTEGDKVLDVPLAKVGGKGLFVKELEEALLDERADIAVHSMKDVPAELPEGLCLPVMCERFEPRDAFVSNQYQSFYDLPQGALVGTSSLRRQSQLSQLRPDLKMMSLRGNVGTRLAKLDRGDYDAIILAAAGLKRLTLDERIRGYFNIAECLPAAGQGVLGIECRRDDAKTLDLIASLHDKNTASCLEAERAMTKCLNGSCEVPIAAYAEIQQEKILLRGLVGRPDGTLILRAHHTGAIENAKNIGITVANSLLQQGAKEILQCLLNKS